MSARESDPDTLSQYVDAAEASFGTIDVIAHRALPVPGSTQVVDIRSQDPKGAYGGPMLALREGRYPTNTDEIALTDGAISDFGVELGGEVTFDGRPRRVVGIVENPADLDDEFGLVLPALDHPEGVTILADASEAAVDAFRPPVDPSMTMIDVRGDDEKTTAAVVVLVVATVAMLFVSLVAAAGFVTLAQRRLRQLGMFAAVGATNRQLRLVMIANGAVVGIVAALIGTASAIVAWIASHRRSAVPQGIGSTGSASHCGSSPRACSSPSARRSQPRGGRPVRSRGSPWSAPCRDARRVRSARIDPRSSAEVCSSSASCA